MFFRQGEDRGFFLSDNHVSVDSDPLWLIIVGLVLSWFIPIAFNINPFYFLTSFF